MWQLFVLFSSFITYLAIWEKLGFYNHLSLLGSRYSPVTFGANIVQIGDRGVCVCVCVCVTSMSAIQNVSSCLNALNEKSCVNCKSMCRLHEEKEEERVMTCSSTEQDEMQKQSC